MVADLTGIFIFAVTGALVAVRKRFDVFGIAALAEITALGGGIFRDLVIGDVPPAAFRDMGYFITPLVAAALVYFLHPAVRRIGGAVQVVDAAGLALFSVSGTVKAAVWGIEPFHAAAIGVATAVGGGVLRDLLAGEIPSLLRRDREMYALPSVLAAGIVAVLLRSGLLGPVSSGAAMLAAFALRLLALRYGWRGPLAWKGEEAAETAGGREPGPRPRTG
ncbi:trimeric intracellular cation channel family protein [Streptomyces sp. FIT100]|uniref:trimeric intracellular cation channel family protein n=1 Tax=Streptomyces sp. FIT100 TaxID=2837956 RepID=UPI0021C6F0E1|nr:trimeric intracellular cation channel family protein [Streptomyces sp. FIT100]UUN31506.1 trimeric intracellular cation channel family protein [Streptomyces sp. FIT100]